MPNEKSCEKCDSEKEEGDCQTCNYSDENSLTHEEAREFTSAG
jgi:hypothetical protein